ncbi:MAG: O-antigen ligase family protein [Deltaproteobacteria bacterium]
MEQTKHILAYALLFLLPLFIIPIDLNFKEILPIYIPAKYFLWGIVVSLMLFFSLSEGKMPIWNQASSFLAAFWVWLACSFLWSMNRHQTLEHFTQWSLICVSIFLFIPLFRKRIDVSILCCLLSVIVGILISFSEKYLSLIHLSPYVLAVSFSSTFANAKFIAHYSIIILPLVIYLLIVSESKIIKWLIASSLILIFSHVYLINLSSKCFFLGLAFNIYLMALIFIRQRKPVYFRKILIISLGIFFMSAGFGVYHTARHLSPERLDSTMQQRWIIWKNTLRMIADHPLLGTGHGTFPLVYLKYESPADRELFPKDGPHGRGWPLFTRQTHSDLLQMAQETGLIGITLFLLFLFSTLKSLIHGCKTEEDPNRRKLCVALIFAISNFFITALFYFPFQEPMSSLLFSFLVSLSMAQVIPSTQCEESRRRFLGLRPRNDTLGFAFGTIVFQRIACLILIPFFIYTSLRFFMSEWHWTWANFKAKSSSEIENELKKTFFWNAKDWEKLWGTGLYHSRQKNYKKAKHFYEETQILSPYSVKIHYNLGVTHHQLGNREESLRYFDKTLEIAPDYSLPYYHLAVSAYYNKKYEKALKLFKKSQTPANLFIDKAYGFAALCHMRLKEPLTAKKELIEALFINPLQPLYHRLFRMLDSQKIVFSNDNQPGRSFSEAFKLLSHPDQKMRSEATVYFLSLPPKALHPLLKLYDLAYEEELHIRLFYILSEKLPHLMVGRALTILNSQKEDSEQLKVLSLMLVSKSSPRHLNRYYTFSLDNKNLWKKEQAEFDVLQKFYAKK